MLTWTCTSRLSWWVTSTAIPSRYSTVYISIYLVSSYKVSVVMAGDLNYAHWHYNFTFVCSKLFLEIAIVSVRIFVGLNTASRRVAGGSLVRRAGQSFGGQRAGALLLLWFLRLLHRFCTLCLEQETKDHKDFPINPLIGPSPGWKWLHFRIY